MKKIGLISLTAIACLSLAACGNDNNSKNSSSSNAMSKAESRRQENDRLKSFAQSFGTKPVAEIQRMPSVYTSDQVEDNMVYTWHPQDMPLLVRVDAPGNFTTVYKYDKNGEHNALGEKLYTGRTIYQRQPKYVLQY